MLQNHNAGPTVDSGGNNRPFAQNDFAFLVDGGSVDIDVLANDFDSDGNLAPESVFPTDPAFGSLEVNNVTGEIRYTHDFSGPATDVFTYTVDDDAGNRSNTATVTLQINPTDVPPVANDDTATVINGGVVTIDVLDNDSSTSPLVPLSVLATTPEFGGVEQSTELADGSLIYTHDGSGPGIDTFSYSVIDSQGEESNSANVSVTITTAPEPTSRVTDGLLALYTFDLFDGSQVEDVSNVGAPLNLTIENGESVIWDGGQLTLIEPTSIASVGAASKINSSVSASGAVTLEAWVQPANTIQTGPARIVSLSSDSRNRNLTLGQGGSSGAPGTFYNVRLRTTTTGNNGFFPTTSSPAGTASTEMTHVVFTRDIDNSVVMYINDTVVSNGGIAGDLTGWNSDFGLFLGNEALGDRPWLGTFDLVAIYGRALNSADVSQNYSAGAGTQ